MTNPLTNPMLHSRFSARIVWLAFLAVLAAGVAVAPLKLAAQESAPAANQAPAASASNDAAKPEAPKSEEESNDVYRHTPLVQSMAKVLHLPVETTARGLEFINFAIIVLAIGIPLFRFLPKFLRKRSQTLTESIESARKVTEDAECAVERGGSQTPAWTTRLPSSAKKLSRRSGRTKSASRLPLEKRAPASWPPPSRKSAWLLHKHDAD